MSSLSRSFLDITGGKVSRVSLKDFIPWNGFRCFSIVLLISHLVLPLESAGKLPEWNDSDYQSNEDFYGRRRVEKRFEAEDHLRLDRLSSARFHPVNGQSLIYLRTQHHLTDIKLSTTTLHWLDLESNRTKELTRPIWGKHDRQVFWIDGRTLLFLSNRHNSTTHQIYQLNLPANLLEIDEFLEPIPITDYPLSIKHLLVNRQGTSLVFGCDVYPNSTIEQTSQRLEKQTSNSVYRFEKLFVRHWDEYRDGRRSHPFLVRSIAKDSRGLVSFLSPPVDLLFALDSDSPTKPVGEAEKQWSFSATGSFFAFTRQHDERSDVAWTTNLDIFQVDLRDEEWITRCLTCDNLAADTDPSYSPRDEEVLLYRSQSISGYEGGQFQLRLINGSRASETLLGGWDRSIQEFVWSPNGETIYIQVNEHACRVIYRLDSVDSSPSRLTDYGVSHDIQVHPLHHRTFLFLHQSILQPKNIYLYSSRRSISPLTDHNSNLLSKVRLTNKVEKFSFVGAKNETVWGWHIPPIGYPSTHRRAPLAFLIHGGPQTCWFDAWNDRWNYQLFASQGYAVIAIDFHGSISYGQNFTDSIRGEYGTLPLEDLQRGLTAALGHFSYIDADRVVALGASFGGYMINWIAGHPQISRRFRALVNHDGVFDLRALAYSTDEQWFLEHDMGGYSVFDNPAAFEKYNPVNHVANWTQPMLVLHSGLDYRIPNTQGISTFTALQRRGIPSRLVYFPNEKHWINEAENALIWYEEVFDWMKKWTQ